MMREDLSSNESVMKQNENINLLLKIERVKPPKSLRAMVEARIANEEQQAVPMQMVWRIAASVAILLVLNIWIVTNSNKTERIILNSATSIATEMNISVSNQLYYD
ncbi:MAG: hypothetical protein ACI9FU_001232 [Granulosicoccus sp.]|jgi:hypothetical protein